MRIWKSLLSLVLVVVMVASLACSAFAAVPAVTVSQQSVYFDGAPCAISAYNIDGANYFKLRDLAKLLSGSTARFSIEASTSAMTIYITTGSAYVSRGDELSGLSATIKSIAVSSWKLSVNGMARTVGAYNIDGSNYYKLRDLGDAVGFGVSFDKATNSVLITSTPTFQAEVPECAAVDTSWFDDVAFVGDSVSLLLSNYAGSKGLGNATFLTSGSLSANNALWPISDESVHPSYQGVKRKIEDSVVLCNANKVYIMLGMNDIGLGLDKAVENYVTLLESILRQSPGVQIFVQSTTPMVKGSTTTNNTLNNTNILEFNRRMKDICQEKGWYFLDVASVFTDAEGYLIKDYCSDYPTMGIHVTPTAVGYWVDYLRTHVPQS